MGKYRKAISQAEFEEIERYLLNRMDMDEQVQFEEKLGNDETLRKEVALQRRLLAPVESGALPVEKAVLQKDRTPVKRLSTTWWYAAAVALLFGIIGIWYFNLRPMTETDLFANYFVPDPGLITPMSAKVDYVFHDAMVDYKRKNYGKAIEKWETLLAQKPQNDTLNYFIGVSYLAQGNIEKSIPLLEHATSSEESVFISEAYFYMGMAHLKAGSIAKAEAALQKSDSEKSKVVLRRLKE